ncbi:MAG: hypothetical protein KAI79_07395, partial [Bacteroidales bacterium]|nr:hypothetical protein [Bacteroidales bacterium]
NMGETLVAATENNKKGYFENEKIVHFNDYILFPALNNNAFDLTMLPENWENSEDIQKLYPLAKEIIENDYAGQKLFGLKDPRLCVLFPFWEKVLNELNITIKIILPYRDPMEVFHSLKRRDDFSQEKSLLLWVKHVLFAEYYSRKYQRVSISYAELLHQPQETVNKILKHLSIDGENLSDNMNKALNTLEKDLKHNNGNNTALQDIPYFIINTKELCLKLIEKQNEELSSDFDEVRLEYITNTNYFLCDNDRIIEEKLENKKLSRSIRKKLRQQFEYFKYRVRNKDQK